jgi:hypothetical protein
MYYIINIRCFFHSAGSDPRGETNGLWNLLLWEDPAQGFLFNFFIVGEDSPVIFFRAVGLPVFLQEAKGVG